MDGGLKRRLVGGVLHILLISAETLCETGYSETYRDYRFHRDHREDRSFRLMDGAIMRYNWEAAVVPITAVPTADILTWAT